MKIEKIKPIPKYIKDNSKEIAKKYAGEYQKLINDKINN